MTTTVTDIDKTGRVVSENIRRLRKESGKSGSEMAGIIGISKMFLYEIETRRKGPSLATLVQIARGLSKVLQADITPSNLLDPRFKLSSSSLSTRSS